jgi:hypothetical protein
LKPLEDLQVDTEKVLSNAENLRIFVQLLWKATIDVSDGLAKLSVGEAVERVRRREIRRESATGEEKVNGFVPRLGASKCDFISDHRPHAVPEDRDWEGWIGEKFCNDRCDEVFHCPDGLFASPCFPPRGSDDAEFDPVREMPIPR